MKAYTLSIFCLAAGFATATPLPSFSLRASDGKTYTPASLEARKPTIVIFFCAGCPHNAEGIKDMNRLLGLVSGKVRIVGMTNLSPARTKQFAHNHHIKFPVLADPTGKAITAFGAKAGLDTALITRQGQLTESWTGYSQGTLRKLFSEIASHGGPRVAINLSSFPKTRQSGCVFMPM